MNPTTEIRYPKGTSKEYTDRVNADYEKVIPLLKEKGYDVDSFTSDTADDIIRQVYTEQRMPGNEYNAWAKKRGI